MLDNEPTGVVGDEPDDAKKNEASAAAQVTESPGAAAAKKTAARRRAASRPAGPPQVHAGDGPDVEDAEAVEASAEAPADKPAKKAAAKKTAAKKTAAPKKAVEVPSEPGDAGVPLFAENAAEPTEPAKAPRTRTRKKAAAAPPTEPDTQAENVRSASADDSGPAKAETEAEAATGATEPGTAPATTAPKRTRARRAATAPAGPPTHHDDESEAAADKTTTSRDVAAQTASAQSDSSATAGAQAEASGAEAQAKQPRQSARAKTVPPVASPFGAPRTPVPQSAEVLAADEAAEEFDVEKETAAELTAAEKARAMIAARAAATGAAPMAAVLFQAPDLTQAAAAKQRQQERREAAKAAREAAKAEQPPEADTTATPDVEEEEHPTTPARRTRERNRSKNRNRADQTEDLVTADASDTEAVERAGEGEEEDDLDEGLGSSSRRRRRRRRRTGADGTVELGPDDPPNTVVKVREAREPRVRQPRDRSKPAFGGNGNGDDDVQGVRGSTRLEAKKQRRREGRDTGRRRAPLITEAEFLARRESVERVMIVRQTGDRTQIGVLEDGVLVEHYVNRATSSSYVGNVYLGKVQNVLPSMEAAFVDIGKGRNAVLYAGEVNFDAAGVSGQAKRIESVLKSGQAVLTQVTKDPIGHKGARLTSQVSLPGRYLVYVPEGTMTGISRKLPENERTRLKAILKQVVPEDAGVIVRTAAEGASEDELRRDVERLAAQWAEIQRKAQSSASSAPTLLYGEPDLTVRVVRDTFNEDFVKLIVSGDEAWHTIRGYVEGIAPDLAPRLERWTSEQDVFAVHRIDEQLAKALDRKVWLPSGGSLVIDRTEAMVVIDVNTGKFTGAGGNLEETVTRNNIEAAEEIVRQLRLRDLGGIVVIDFIDMVLESNRDLVMRRLLECLGRDRTKHQVAEVTSLGLVQMTRKRVGQGLLEAFSETCDKCNGRGVLVHMEPVQIGKNEHFHEHESGPSSQSQKQSQKPSGGGANANAGKTADTVAAATDTDNGTEPTTSGRTSRRKRRKSHGHESRQQFDVDGISEEFRDFVEEPDSVVGGPVTVTRVAHGVARDADAKPVDAEVKEADSSLVADVRDMEVTQPATFRSEPASPAVTSSPESEAAVEAALGGSASVSVGGDTAAPKKRGLRVRRAAKRPAGPPASHE